MEKNIDELKKKVLELRDVIDKKDGEIEKYQRALEIASVDIVKSIEECVEECSVCPEQIYDVLGVLEEESGDRMKIYFQVETSLFPLLRFATIIGFGFTLGILGAAEVVWMLWVLVQLAKGLM